MRNLVYLALRETSTNLRAQELEISMTEKEIIELELLDGKYPRSFSEARARDGLFIEKNSRLTQFKSPAEIEKQLPSQDSKHKGFLKQILKGRKVRGKLHNLQSSTPRGYTVETMIRT
eukprot:GHVU01101981.1.p3 GENE.GHVU01101981.1~~GHVU01101981.1.p3  ORF type:complete len:118 (+),score=13.58 GHVU01101981.1:945-1298(+)